MHLQYLIHIQKLTPCTVYSFVVSSVAVDFEVSEKEQKHRCIARGGHGLPKVAFGPAMPNHYALGAGHHWNGPTAVSGVACPQSGRPTAVFDPFVHPTPYPYEQKWNQERKGGPGGP
jgi:hypothetical protein